MTIPINGFPVDDETRCKHYRSPLDIIAIRFRCCDQYYPCIHCHEEASGHPVQRWPEAEWNRKAILCGACKTELTIRAYFASGYQCPACNAAFNPKCSNHDHFYFDPSAGSE